VLPEFANYNERIRRAGGFHLDNAAGRRQWNTPSGKARFLVAHGPRDQADTPADLLMLATVRSHDQYNTTIYGLNDRYRGIAGRRDVVFVNPDDLAERGLREGDRIDVEASRPDGVPNGRAVRGFVAVAFGIARASLAMYYPEGNDLLALEDHDARSGTPGYKSIPVRLRASAVVADGT
jgi:anaerobic selenocysteine-containing dehydrogenase